MTELQKAELQLLQHFIDICDKLHLKYFLVCGSALGAVKYGGFIPWDDDIDVALARDDYETFCTFAQGMLPQNIFLQNYKTDSAFPHIYSKLRNSDTTYIEKSAEQLDINHGIYIDIFPLDGYPKKKIAQLFFELKKRIYESMFLSAYEIPRAGKSVILYYIYKFFRIPLYTSVIAKKYDRMITKYHIKETDIIANHGNWQGKKEYAPIEQYGYGVFKTFENLTVRIPEKFDAYLTQKYGDWRAELPKEKQIGHHTYVVCDTSLSYQNYMKVKKGK